MSAPFDQPQRDRFITELDRNFSVVASAGSGKTRAITDRITAIARSPRATELLPTLVVVTFTNRAADEMQQRARQCILDERVSLDVLAAFNRAFFGTIHSFCVKLLRQHGHHLGLPGKLDLLQNDSALWMEYVQQQTTLATRLTDAQRRCLLRLVPVRELMELGRTANAPGDAETPRDCPPVECDNVFAFIGRGAAKNTIAATQERLREWERAWREGDGFLPLPECSSKAKEFAALWETTLGPIREWLRCCSLHTAAEIAREYRAFRLAKGAIRYDDQISLAGELLRAPEAARRIRERNYRVILDEAQDTDPAQFDVLLAITHPPDATSEHPRPGHFCMVGDFQQSIFGERADLSHYRSVHDALISSPAGESVTFSVTFRLDEKQIEFVNEIFPSVLTNTDRQVAFVPLNARPNVLPGQIIRFDLGELPQMDGWNDWKRTQLEARRLAAWLREQGLERLRARSWRDVAILCPRKNWFAPLRDALRAEGIEVQIQSERDLKGDSPAYAWFTALAAIIAAPRDGYQIVGVLREVFGISDHELAAFSQADGTRFQIATATARTGVVGETLNLLAGIRTRVADLPLFTAMQEIVSATRLRDRLLALPADVFEHSTTELDDLLTLAASAEAAEKTLADFAEDLRADFSATREVRTTSRDAIQLITIHKAKGSEWQAVIIPFFARGVRQRSRGYPRLLRHPGTGVLHPALDAEDITAGLKELLDMESRQELERLLYVALTRAKHTLVLAHDHALFSGKTGLPKNAPARLLNCGEPSRFTALQTTLAPCAATRAHQAATLENRALEHTVEPLLPCPPDALSAARARATLFIKRNPSALAEAALADAESTAFLEPIPQHRGTENSGTRYGIRWHSFMERVDWRADPAAWDSLFGEALGDSPEAELFTTEWTQLRDQLAGNSELARLLRKPGLIAHAEMPFLWAMNERECLEGIIDLAIFDPATGAWLILDWKTNRPTDGGAQSLHDHYRPQLSAYWRAVSQMLGAPVSAGLYSTAFARWLPYESDALAAAWSSLENQPAKIANALAER